ncbi:hypothetical protein GOBAR_AA07993 [Gossypium barbadense]|uniref:Erythromycin biosynthesis protein CIII-like C-terminal domain-containing protein n=1 Tax=Gossypium barbadense TaxID=3634 RepID=A0A2P5YAN5_GOSBA|nr:hypothetical protein GOBAR_AA07993 [Gossypium barbadense]
MPWTPTSEFPHPLSRVKQPAGYRLSYQIVDSMIWLGIRDMINDVRKKKLKLRPVTYLSGSQGSDSDVPHGYIWSPHLVPKPKDVVVSVHILASFPVQEPERMTQIIVNALEQTGQRGIINKGWGGLGNLAEPKDFVYILDNVPHDWLFLRCKAVVYNVWVITPGLTSFHWDGLGMLGGKKKKVKHDISEIKICISKVHHGGAGTTAAGLKAACPTTIVPFFGDQPFWGERVHARGVGPPPIPVDEFSLPKLVGAIKFMLDPKVKEKAKELAKAMENEDGVTGAVKAFLKHLNHKKPESEPSPVQSGLFSISRCFRCS